MKVVLLLLIAVLLATAGCAKLPMSGENAATVVTDEGYGTNCYPVKVEGCDYFLCMTYPMAGILTPKVNQTNPLCR